MAAERINIKGAERIAREQRAYAPMGAAGADCPSLCGRALDSRGFCPVCQPAQVACPKCKKVLKDGPDHHINWQVCFDCLDAITARERNA